MRLCDSCYWMKPSVVGQNCSLLNRACPRWKTCKHYKLDEDKDIEVEVFFEKERDKKIRK